MKFYILVFVAMLTFQYSNLEARIIVKTMENAGTNGKYNYVNEAHETGPSSKDYQKMSTLKCKDPGNTDCKWTSYNPFTLPDLVTGYGNLVPFSDLETFATNKVTIDNVLSGNCNFNINFDGENWLRNVSWTASSQSNYTITMTINPAP